MLQLTLTLNVCWRECFCTLFLLEKFSCLSNETQKQTQQNAYWIIHRQTNLRSVKTWT